MALRTITACAVIHDIPRRDEYTPDLIDQAERLVEEERLLREAGEFGE